MVSSVVGVGLGDAAALTLLARWDWRELSLGLGEDGAVAFLYGLVFARLLPPECVVDRLGYFTARVSGKLEPGAPGRQQVLFNALATLTEVELHYGRFLAKTAWRTLANLPAAGRRIDTPQPVTFEPLIPGPCVREEIRVRTWGQMDVQQSEMDREVFVDPMEAEDARGLEVVLHPT